MLLKVYNNQINLLTFHNKTCQIPSQNEKKKNTTNIHRHEDNLNDDDDLNDDDQDQRLKARQGQRADRKQS